MEIPIDELQNHVVSQQDSWWIVDGARYLPIDLVMPVSGVDLGRALDRYKGKVVRIVVPDAVPRDVSLDDLLSKRGVIELEWNDDLGEQEEWDLYDVTDDVRDAERALISDFQLDVHSRSSLRQ